MSAIPSAMKVTPFQRLLWAFLVIVIVVLCAAFAVRSFERSEGQGQAEAAPLPQLVVLPPFSLTDQDGKTVASKDLAGKIWVAQFFFTECPGPCPAVSRQLAAVQGMIDQIPFGAVKLVSISIDPADDTPAKLRAYAARVGADPRRWRFLTGSEAAIQDLVRKGFLIAFQKNAPDLQASQGIFVHSTKVALVDRTGAVRAYYEGTDVETPQKIVADIGSLLREPRPEPAP